jgi:OPA family glycerol-3-phosphate transporter-like MFS transporter
MKQGLNCKLVFWDIWFSYATYYLGRVNLSLILPVMMAQSYGLDLYKVGIVSSVVYFAYAAGQFINGQLVERFNPIRFLRIGLIGSGVMNIFMGLWGEFYPALLIGAFINGYFQSMGWSATLRTNALIQNEERDKSSPVILGISYQFGNIASWFVCTFAIYFAGWRAGFLVAGCILCLKGILLAREKQVFDTVPQILKKQLALSFHPKVLLCGIALCFVNFIRYGVITWIPLYLYKYHNLFSGRITKTGMTVLVLPLAGILGTLMFNKIHLEKSKLAIVYLLALMASIYIVSVTSGLLSIGCLLISGFFLFGPHVYLVSIFPASLKKDRIVGASTGMVDGIGYLGVISVGFLVPWLVNISNGDWRTVFYFWILAAFIAIIVIHFNNLLDCNKRVYARINGSD